MILDFFLRVEWLGALWAFKLFLTTVLKSCASLNTYERKSTCCKLHIYMAWNRCKESSVAWDDLSYKSLFHSNHIASRFLCLNEMEQLSLKHKTTTQNSNTISSAQVMKIKEKYQWRDYWLILYKFLQTRITRIIWQTEIRITDEISRVTGLLSKMFQLFFFN